MSDVSPEEELTRLALRVISGAQGALETLLAPGGVVESVGGAIAGLLDEVGAPSAEVKENLAEAASALGRAWQALVAGVAQTTAPSSSESLPLDRATNVTNPATNDATAAGASQPDPE